jgi:hypothetical protein
MEAGALAQAFLTHDDVTVTSVINELNWFVCIIVYDRG